MKPSDYQQTIINLATADYSQNITVNAVAGSGKTTLIQMLAKELPTKNLYLAFSKEICQSVEPKLAGLTTEVKTLHKFGFQVIRSVYPECVVDATKYEKLIGKQEFKPLNHWHLKKLTEILRLWFQRVDQELVLDALEHCDLDQDQDWLDKNLLNLTALLKAVISKGVRSFDTCDFADMLVIPLINSLPFPAYDCVFIDEAQDLNNVMIATVKKLMRTARIVLVGDPLQAIMGFAGANQSSYEVLQNTLNAKELPLSVCYRCGDKIIKLARQYNSAIQGTEREGTVSYQKTLEGVQHGDMVLCRVNAPLIECGIDLIDQGHHVKIKGKNFGETLIKLTREAQKSYSGLEIETAIQRVIANKLSKIRSKDKKDLLLDQQNCLLMLCDHCDDAFELIQKIGSLFSESPAEKVITLSSMHRSKGLEADNVFILLNKREFTLPGDNQESNLAYVAVTRAKKSLVFVS